MSRSHWHAIPLMVIAALVVSEALILLWGFGLGSVPLKVYDAIVKHQMAVNLLDQGALSHATQPPYSPTSHWAPGFPAFVALVYGIAGRSISAVRGVQFMILGLAGWLLYRLVVRLLDSRRALIAAILLVTYPPFVFYATDFSDGALSIFLGVAVMQNLIALQDARRPEWRAMFLGVVCGGFALVRASFLLIIFPLVGSLWLMRIARISRPKAAALMLLGFAVVIAPWSVRMVHLVGRPVVATSAGRSLDTSARQYAGVTSYLILPHEWEPMIDDFNRRNREAERALFEERGVRITDDPGIFAQMEDRADRAFLGNALARFQTINAGQYVRSWGQRMFWLWSTADMSPWQTNEFLFHRFQQVYHVLLVVLIVGGIIVFRSEWKMQWILWMIPGYLMVVHTVFHMEPRYSFPGRSFLLVYAAIAIDSALRLSGNAKRYKHQEKMDERQRRR